MKTENHYGVTVKACIHVDSYPEFQIIRRLSNREDSRRGAFRDMRQGFCPQIVLFIREDGFHEVWNRAELENEFNPSPNPTR